MDNEAWNDYLKAPNDTAIRFLSLFDISKLMMHDKLKAMYLFMAHRNVFTCETYVLERSKRPSLIGHNHFADVFIIKYGHLLEDHADLVWLKAFYVYVTSSHQFDVEMYIKKITGAYDEPKQI